MATYVLIHGASHSGWYWHLVDAELRRRGHDVVTMDLPSDDASAGLAEYADTVVEAIEAVQDRTSLIVVAHSFGAYTAPIVCSRIPVDLLVLVAGMVPLPGETAEDWWANTGYEAAKRDQDERDGRTRDDDVELLLHDVPPDVVSEALAKRQAQSGTPFGQPWPLPAWPEVPTRFLLCRDDHFFPAGFMRRVVRERLGIVPEEIDSGHTPALSQPKELADRLEAYRIDLRGSDTR